MADRVPDATTPNHGGALPPDDIGSSARAVFRDLNRNLVDLLGPCPETTDGTWIVVGISEAGAPIAVLPELSVASALRISTALAGLAEGHGPALQSASGAAPGAHSFDMYFGLAAARTSSRVHVEVPR